MSHQELKFVLSILYNLKSNRQVKLSSYGFGNGEIEK